MWFGCLCHRTTAASAVSDFLNCLASSRPAATTDIISSNWAPFLAAKTAFARREELCPATISGILLSLIALCALTQCAPRGSNRHGHAFSINTYNIGSGGVVSCPEDRLR